MSLTNEQLIEKVKTAYKLAGKIPSRGASEDSTAHAGALHALLYADRLREEQWLGDQSQDWRDGLHRGFEWVHGEPRWEEYRRGIEQGIAVAKAVFSWPEAPNIYHPFIARETKRNSITEGLRREVKELRKIIEKLGATK